MATTDPPERDDAGEPMNEPTGPPDEPGTKDDGTPEPTDDGGRHEHGEPVSEPTGEPVGEPGKFPGSETYWEPVAESPAPSVEHEAEGETIILPSPDQEGPVHDDGEDERDDDEDGSLDEDDEAWNDGPAQTVVQPEPGQAPELDVRGPRVVPGQPPWT